jgi:8-oxo-dGTP pyrophosphatase MutT (NUDIX family)
MSKSKAVPVVTRRTGTAKEILVFEHPTAGVQLIKGTIELGEASEAACLRELHEESGISNARIERFLGSWQSHHQDQTWHFYKVEVLQPLRESWYHQTAEDHGHVFRLFWHPMHIDPEADWHSVYRSALGYLRHALQK